MGPVVRARALVGRDAELAATRRLVAAAQAGTGGGLLVTGEAGIGKTRLLAETADVAREAGLTVLTGRAVPGGGAYRAVSEALLGCLRETRLRDTRLGESTELRPFRAALGRLVPGWAGADDHVAVGGGLDPALVLGEGLLRLLRAIGGPAGVLLVLEDLHWADGDTLALVEYLVAASRTEPVLVAASARDDEASAAGRLAAGASMTTLRLGRLDAAAVTGIVAACIDEAVPAEVLAAVIAKADGLPVLVEELLAGLVAGADTVPPTLIGLVAARVAHLDAAGAAVLHAAAVLGADPDWSLLAPVTGLAEPAVLAALRAAVQAGLLTSDGERMGWRHALTRDAVLAGLLPPERSVLARRAADAVLERGGAGEGAGGDDVLAADLLIASGQNGRAAAVLVRLARADTERGALRSAEELLARAVGTGVPAAAFVADQVRLLTLLGRVDDALGAGSAALATVAGPTHAELCLQLARSAITGGRWDLARGYVERAGRPDDPRSGVLAAEAAFGAGDPDRAAALAAAAAELAERQAAPEPLCGALVVIGRGAALSDMRRAAAAFGRVAQLAAEHGLTPLRVEALMGIGLIDLMDTATSDAQDQARDLAMDAGMLSHVLSIDVIRCDFALAQQGPRAAAPRGLAIAEQAGRLHLSGLQALGEVHAAACRAAVGDVETMAALLDAATARAHASLEVATLAAAVRALPHLLAHDLPRANRLLDAGMGRLVDHGSAAPLMFWGLWVLLRTAVGDRDGEARQFLRTAPAGLRACNRGALAYADAVAAGRAGEAGTAAERLAAGDALLAGQHWWRRVLRLLALESAVVDGWGDPVPALRTDLTAFEDDGEHLLARTCRDLLRQAGAPTRRGRGATPVPPELRALGVTSREMDVLDLVVAGLTNAAVADRLFLSPRTVETHVANLLAKTGTTGRDELRALR